MAQYFYISERRGRGGRRGGGVKKTKSKQNTNRTCYHVSFPSHRGGRRGGGVNKKTKTKQNTNRTCYHCKEKGHVAKDCEKRKAEEAEKVLAAGGTEPPVNSAEVVALRKQLEEAQKKIAEATGPKST